MGVDQYPLRSFHSLRSWGVETNNKNPLLLCCFITFTKVMKPSLLPWLIPLPKNLMTSFESPLQLLELPLHLPWSQTTNMHSILTLHIIQLWTTPIHLLDSWYKHPKHAADLLHMFMPHVNREYPHACIHR